MEQQWDGIMMGAFMVASIVGVLVIYSRRDCGSTSQSINYSTQPLSAIELPHVKARVCDFGEYSPHSHHGM